MKLLNSLIILVILGTLSGCTYSINMVHTQGDAKDVVDENQKADADIKADLTIPAL